MGSPLSGPGDRIALEPGVPCRRCAACKSGRYNLCAEVRFFATPPVDGSMATYVTHPADFCYRLPDHVSLDEGAMMEPLSVGIHACRRGGVSMGDRVLVMGAGPIGLVTVLAVRAAGASVIALSDPRTERLGLARQVGADLVTSAAGPGLVPELLDRAGGMFDVSVDCSGAEAAVRVANERYPVGRQGGSGGPWPGRDDLADRRVGDPGSRPVGHLPVLQRLPRGTRTDCLGQGGTSSRSSRIAFP